ncbi:probable multidrug resistance-associated protein lethal(2)03659 isoform X1 [Athalia rosae]|uniref:probable multidrug resistance-associated protein lethal(2)03659 isoform X1 n=1 Tax=Athalia rosae TaxID=37344 RepID=UPI0020341F50|nr:probable multidrug resistance-associated protein lethal(2)03659 isoform X1 [Athalia rosae]
MEKNKRQQRLPNPRETANPLSFITFAYVRKMFMLGFKRDLEVEDLYEPLKGHECGKLGDRVAQEWANEVKRAKNADKTSQPSLFRVLRKCFGLQIMLLGSALTFSELCIRSLQPLMLAGLLRYFNTDSNMAIEEAYLWAMGVALTTVVHTFILHPVNYELSHVGMKMRVACCSLVYNKCFKLSRTTLAETNIGQIVNLLSNDVSRFDSCILLLPFLWIGPMQTVLMTYFIYVRVGWAAVTGILTLLIFVPLQGFLGKLSSKLRLRVALRTDTRIRLMDEIINGIQVIKMYAWEEPLSLLVEIARRKEVQEIRKNVFIQGITGSFDSYLPRLCIFITILVYVSLGNVITAEQVFLTTAFYNILRIQMTQGLPNALLQIAETSVSIRRLRNFMLLAETEITSDIDVSSNAEKKEHLPAVVLNNASANWRSDSQENTLSNLNVTIEHGQLVAIIGAVGSGKSSLVQTILRELPLKSGSIKVNGQIAFASQEPWLFSSSIRQNILFGRPMDESRYQKVVNVCQLKRDFTLFSHGDKTLVGERGISLSGGQRARINLARAVYADADIYLFDDPLSAVDAHVGRHMFEECIDGYLLGKTRILITHQHQYLKHVDRIIVMNKGTVEAVGTFDELQTAGLDFAKLLEKSKDPEGEEKQPEVYRRLSSVPSIQSEQGDDMDPVEVAEMRTTGQISGDTYISFLKAAGSIYFILAAFTVFISCQVAGSGVDYFISYWVNLEEASVDVVNGTIVIDWAGPLTRDICIQIYSGLVVATIITSFARVYLFFDGCMRASRNLHKNLFASVSRATMRFFNTNTSGRILNRFSKDIGAVDELLPLNMLQVIQVGLMFVGTSVIIGIANPLLIILTLLVIAVMYMSRLFYVRTSRSIKRLEGITRSPVFAHLSATLNGLPTIRAFHAEAILAKEFDNHQNLHSSAWFMFIAGARCFGYYLDLTSVIYVTLVTFSFLVFDQDTFGGTVGLAITQCLGLTQLLQWGMRMFTEMENQMTSVERVVEYSNLESEPPLESTPENKPPREWPSLGKIEFRDLSLRYDPEEPPVLNHMNFTIHPREKIGIVGRTGAGKSSMISALFRLALNEGEIYIDDVPTSKLGLHDLRSKICIIPQEPVIFSGHLRENLDPFTEYSDDVLWQALDEVKLKETVNLLPGGLSSKMSESGSNFSAGQRQLICLARAIVKRNQILIMDEATANVDPQTDVFIQETIRKKFVDCTVLTIAHRLNTIMDSDRVLVMDAGTVLEFDHPHILLQNPSSHFFDMVHQNGQSLAKNLKEIADQVKSSFYKNISRRISISSDFLLLLNNSSISYSRMTLNGS